jgi:hypothetical protein
MRLNIWNISSLIALSCVGYLTRVASAGELMKVSAPEGAIAQTGRAASQSRQTDIIAPGELVEVLQFGLKDPDGSAQKVAAVYFRGSTICANPDRPCFVPYDHLTFQKPHKGDLSEMTIQISGVVKNEPRPDVTCRDQPSEMLHTSSHSWLNSLKSPEELERYFSCFELKPGFTQRYQEELHTYVEAASGAFELPYPFLSCVLFRESRWDANAFNSSSHAAGLGQFLPASFDTLKTILHTKSMPPQEVERLLSSAKADHDVDNENTRYVRSVLETRDYALKWDSYVDNITSGPIAPVTPHSSRTSTDMRFDPELSVGFSALYLNRIQILVIDALRAAHNPLADRAALLWRDPDYLAVLAEAYDMGETKLLRLIEPVIGGPPSAWRAQLARHWDAATLTYQSESQAAMKSIEALERKMDLLETELKSADPKNKKRIGKELEQARASRNKMEALIDHDKKAVSKTEEERNYGESIYRCAQKGNGRAMPNIGAQPDAAPSCHL